MTLRAPNTGDARKRFKREGFEALSHQVLLNATDLHKRRCGRGLLCAEELPAEAGQNFELISSRDGVTRFGRNRDVALSSAVAKSTRLRRSCSARS
jgi:hypothetical protein